MPESINHEKQIEFYEPNLTADEKLLYDSINDTLKTNTFSGNWEKDINLLSFDEDFDIHSEEWEELFSNDIHYFEDKEVWQQFYKLKYDLEKRLGFSPSIVSDREDIGVWLTLDSILNEDYTGIDNMLSWDEYEKSFCLSFIQDISSYTWLNSDIKKTLLEKINQYLIQDINNNLWITKKIVLTIDRLSYGTDYTQEIADLNYQCFMSLFQNIPFKISKEINPIWWVNKIILNNDLLTDPSSMDDFFYLCADSLDNMYFWEIFHILNTFWLDILSENLSIIFLEKHMLQNFSDLIWHIAYTKEIFIYMINNNQFSYLTEQLSWFDLEKKTMFVYAFRFWSEYFQDQTLISHRDELISDNPNLKDALHLTIAWIWKKWFGDVNLSLYNHLLWTNLTNIMDMDASNVEADVLQNIDLDEPDSYTHQLFKCASEDLQWEYEDILETFILNSENPINDIQSLDNLSLSIGDISRISNFIELQETEEKKQEVWLEFLIINPTKFIWSLNNFDTNEVFWFDNEYFEILYANAPYRNDDSTRRRIREDFIKISEIIKETWNINATKDLFETYNITEYRRYSKPLLKHLITNKEIPTWKPIFPIFMTKRDFNWAFENILDNWGKLDHLLEEYDVRVFEPWDDNDNFFTLMETFYENYISNWWERNNVNSIFGMHWSETSMLKKWDISQTIESIDKVFFQNIKKYINWWNIILESCSTWWNSGWEENIAQSMAKWCHCKVIAPTEDASLWDIIYNLQWWIEFADFYSVPTAIYDGRFNLETFNDQINITTNNIQIVKILENDIWAEDYLLQEWSFGNITIEEVETNKRKIKEWEKFFYMTKELINWEYVVYIDPNWIQDWTFEVPYTAYSKAFPKKIVDENREREDYENNFRLETDGKIQIDISFVTLVENKESQKLDISLYPNPCTDYFNLKLPDTLNNYNGEFQIFNITWKSVTSSSSITKNPQSINVSNLTEWTYIITWKVWSKPFSWKFIKK